MAFFQALMSSPVKRGGGGGRGSGERRPAEGGSRRSHRVPACSLPHRRGHTSCFHREFLAMRFKKALRCFFFFFFRKYLLT